MLGFRFENVVIDSFAVNLPNKCVSSSDLEERLSPVYKRLKIPKGTLEKLTGVRTRYFWDETVMPSQVATVAALKALEKTEIDRKEINGLMSCAITRDYFEPATTCLIHNDLGISEDSITFDIGNACLGFMNGLSIMSSLIERGTVRAGLVVSGETIWRPIDHCINQMLNDEEMTRE